MSKQVTAIQVLNAIARIVDQRPPTAQEIIQQRDRVLARIDQVLAAVNTVDAQPQALQGLPPNVAQAINREWLARRIEIERSPFAQNVALKDIKP